MQAPGRLMWLARVYSFLLGLGFTAAGFVAIGGVDRTWGGILLVLPTSLLLMWLGLAALWSVLRSFRRPEPSSGVDESEDD